MEIPGTFFVILLLAAALSSQTCSASSGADSPTACCFSYTSRQIQPTFVDGYFETSGQCSKPAVVFLTKRGSHVCANPSDAWVREYIADLE